MDTLTTNWIQIGLLLVAIATVIVSSCWNRKALKQTQELAKKQHQFQFFAEYTKRYQDIILNMPDDIYNGTAKMDSGTMRYMRLYFDLCSEEYHLWQNNAIPDKVWNLWVEGMQITCNHQIYQHSWNALKGEYSKEFWRYFEQNVINHKNV